MIYSKYFRQETFFLFLVNYVKLEYVVCTTLHMIVNDVFMYYKILLSRLYSVCISNNIQIIVLAVVMFMVAFSFLMKQSEVKILMNVLCILICIMYLIYLAWTLPLSRFGVPRVGKFQCCQL